MSTINAFISVCLFQGVESSGILEMHFLEYKNIHGRSHEGEKCPVLIGVKIVVQISLK